MRQLLIVKSPTSFATSASPIDNGLTSHDVKDISGLKEGAITFFGLGDDTSVYQSAPTKNFAIALGRPNGQLPFMIPEVDVKTLQVTKTLPRIGTHFSVVFTMPTTVAGKEYTLRFFKKGAVPHERNSWTVSIVAGSTTAATEASAFKKMMDAKVSDKFNFTTTLSTAQLTITCNTYDDWDVVALDTLAGVSLTKTSAVTPVGDKDFVSRLASFCAAGKGFRDTDYQGREFLPGYPEAVEDFTLNSSGAYINGTDNTNGNYSTSGYAIYTLRFKVGRDAAKQRDERVWQNVYIACPVDGNGTYSQIDNLDKIIPAGDFSTNMMASVAAAKITTMVKSTALES